MVKLRGQVKLNELTNVSKTDLTLEELFQHLHVIGRQLQSEKNETR